MPQPSSLIYGVPGIGSALNFTLGGLPFHAAIIFDLKFISLTPQCKVTIPSTIAAWGISSLLMLVSSKDTVKQAMKREKNIRIALSDEEYELLKSESDKRGIPMTSLIRLYIQTLKAQNER